MSRSRKPITREERYAIICDTPSCNDLWGVNDCSACDEYNSGETDIPPSCFRQRDPFWQEKQKQRRDARDYELELTNRKYKYAVPLINLGWFDEQYKGTYYQKFLLVEIAGFERERYRLFGKKEPRSVKAIAKSLGMKELDPYADFNKEAPLWKLLAKTGSSGEV